MSRAGRDLRHGRQGGRVVDWDAKQQGQQLCAMCGLAMVHPGGRDRHHMCDPSSIGGKVCDCAPGCTDTRIGDQSTCQPSCAVCTRFAGELHRDVFGKAAPAADADPAQPTKREHDHDGR